MKIRELTIGILGGKVQNGSENTCAHCNISIKYPRHENVIDFTVICIGLTRSTKIDIYYATNRWPCAQRIKVHITRVILRYILNKTHKYYDNLYNKWKWYQKDKTHFRHRNITDIKYFTALHMWNEIAIKYSTNMKNIYCHVFMKLRLTSRC